MEALYMDTAPRDRTKGDVYASLPFRDLLTPVSRKHQDARKSLRGYSRKGDLIVISVLARAENCAIEHDEKLGYAICGLLLFEEMQAPCHATCSC